MPSEAALGLKPFGQYAFLLFSAGLFNASIFAACILPLSTAYSVCEGLGFESGVNRRIREAPIFYCLYTLLIVVGAGVVLIPQIPAGADDPLVAGAQRHAAAVHPDLHDPADQQADIMGEWANPKWFNLVSWIAAVMIIGLTLAYVGITVRGMH